jgi:hypothetical protein
MAQLLDLRTSPRMGKLCANRVAFDDVSFEVGYGKVSEVGTVEFISRRPTRRSALPSRSGYRHSVIDADAALETQHPHFRHTLLSDLHPEKTLRTVSPGGESPGISAGT